MGYRWTEYLAPLCYELKLQVRHKTLSSFSPVDLHFFSAAVCWNFSRTPSSVSSRPLLPFFSYFLLFYVSFFFFCSCVVLSNKRSPKRNLPNQPLLIPTSRRWRIRRCPPPLNCLTTALQPPATCWEPLTPTRCEYLLWFTADGRRYKQPVRRSVNGFPPTGCRSVWTARRRRWCSCAASSGRRRWSWPTSAWRLSAPHISWTSSERPWTGCRSDDEAQDGRRELNLFLSLTEPLVCWTAGDREAEVGEWSSEAGEPGQQDRLPGVHLVLSSPSHTGPRSRARSWPVPAQPQPHHQRVYQPG